MWILHRIITSTLAGLYFLTGSLGWGALTPADRMVRRARPLVLTSSPQNFSKGSDFSLIQPMTSLRTMDTEDVSRIIPLNLNPNADSSLISSQIVEHSLTHFMKSDFIRNSNIGRTTAIVEESLAGNVAIGGEDDKSIQHQLKFAMKATEATAQVEYTGLLSNARVSYRLASSGVDLEVRESSSTLNSQIVYNRTHEGNEITDMISLRWPW
jgi:hypothetical protein